MYKTNNQAWDEVTREIIKNRRLTQITLDLFGQKTFKGLTKDQRDQVYKQY